MEEPNAQQYYEYDYQSDTKWLSAARYGQVEGSTKTLSEAYRVDNLTYDKNGNILTLNRSGTSSAPNMDKLAYTYHSQSNQLTHVDDTVSPSAYPNDIDDQAPNNYEYNEIGQLIFNKQDNVGYEYYTNGLTKAIYNGKIGEAGTTKRVEFQYNESGHRIKKLSYNNQGTLLKTTFYVRDAAGTAIAIYFKDEGSTDKSIILAENGVYGSSRLGMLNRTTETMLYEIKDHLGNVRAVVGKDANGNMASIVKGRADYYPFGMQFPDKQDLDYRYAYQGQEKDDETGMEAFELRLWDSRIGRWLTPDPVGQYPSPYLGMGNNPISRIDPDGGKDGEGNGRGWLWRAWNKFKGGLGFKDKTMLGVGDVTPLYDMEEVSGDESETEVICTTGCHSVELSTENVDIGGAFRDGAGTLGLGATIFDSGSDLLKKASLFGKYSNPIAIGTGISSTIGDYYSYSTESEFVSNTLQTGVETTVGLSNPTLAIGLHINFEDAKRNDGLTNVHNGRLAKSYLSTYNQTQTYLKNNFYGKKDFEYYTKPDSISILDLPNIMIDYWSNK
ncbi:hypothetical protein UJ101_01527 [Flavobacteriaceae bacterium UJ101]|nr:hypothetical protein UJ101_01527 [Flavobacteriaceae bacterium UJ101]